MGVVRDGSLRAPSYGVAIGCETRRNQMFRQIVVGVDELEGGRDAIALADNLRARDAELTLAQRRPRSTRVGSAMSMRPRTDSN